MFVVQQIQNNYSTTVPHTLSFQTLFLIYLAPVLLLFYQNKVNLYFSFGGKSTDTLSGMRHKKYIDMVSTSNSVQPENLPPTERASFFHALRVHLQV